MKLPSKGDGGDKKISDNEATNETTDKSNVISDKSDNDFGFDVDWDTVENNYRHYRRHHHHSTENSSAGKSDAFSKQRKRFDKKEKNSGKRKVAKRVVIGILLFLLCLIIGIISAFLIMRYNGKKDLLNYDNLNIDVPDGTDYEDGGNIIYYNGHTYKFNRNIAAILFMGIDNTSLNESDTIGVGGQADALYLFTYDTTTGKIKILSLNRDTITDISRYDENGNYYDTTETQLCLAFAYGDGKESSAENQVTAVERLIYNVPINAYYAIDLSVIKILNDDIGGVTLTPEYTFGSFTAGEEVTLVGDMAEEYVRTRDTSQLDDNLRRMSCQRQYITSFANRVVPAILNDFTLPLTLYQDTAEYTITDIDISSLTYLASSLALQYDGLEFITVDGKYQKVDDDNSAQFIVDETDLFETILDIFYTK